MSSESWNPASYVLLSSEGHAPQNSQVAASDALLAIIMPLHPPKFRWARIFLQSIRTCSVEKVGWFPVFSSLRDLQAFVNLSSFTDGVEVALPLIVHPARTNPVTSKKWLALRYVFSTSRIPYAFALDAEVAFVSPAPVAAIRQWLEAAVASPRMVLGTAEFAKAKWWPPAFDGRPILRATRESCGLLHVTGDEWSRLNQSGVLDHFWWFADAPLYERAHFFAFWRRLRWQSSSKSLSWYAFDHITYSCYLLLSSHSHLVSVDDMLSPNSLVRSRGTGDLCCGLEIATVTEQEQLANAHGYPFFWTHAAMLARTTGPLPRRLLTYHIDRCEEGGACRRPSQRQRLQSILHTCGGTLNGGTLSNADQAPLVKHIQVHTRRRTIPSQPQRNPTHPSVAIVTLVTTLDAGWVEGARTLACSLQQNRYQQGSRHAVYELIAICPHGSTTVLRMTGWRCIRPRFIQNPYASKRRNRRTHPWPWDYTLKIAPFALVEYSRVLVIDSDVLVVQIHALHDLLRWPIAPGSIVAARDCAAQYVRRVLGGWDSQELQAGVFVARPSIKEYQRLLAAVSNVSSVDESAQGFFTNYWRGRIAWLPSKYNYQCTTRCVALYDLADGVSDYSMTAMAKTMRIGRRQAEQIVDRHLDEGRIGLVHYHYRPKPWQCTAETLDKCGISWEAGSTRVDKLHKLWFHQNASCQKHAHPPTA